VQILMSQMSASSKPAARQYPSIAAIKGFSIVIPENPTTPLAAMTDAADASAARPTWARSLRSAPALKVLPAPVMTAALMSSLSRTRWSASTRARLSSRFMALRTSGRLRVMTATWSVTSTSRMSLLTMFLL
jgi:hypothetical protein